MSRRSNFQCVKRRMEVKRCEMCGSEEGLEVHHIIPVSCGGSDDESNLKVLCGKCHTAIHNKDRSYLTKMGIAKMKQNSCVKYISVEDFYKAMNQYFEDVGEIPPLSYVYDVIDRLPKKLVEVGEDGK